MQFRFGDPNLFVKGIADVTVYDPKTGDVLGYDQVLSDGAVTGTHNDGAIEGGLGNALVTTIPDTSRLSGTLSSQAFSLRQRALMVGSTVEQNGVVPVCQPAVKPTSGKLVLPASAPRPVKSYGQASSDENCWCQIRKVGVSSYSGKNYQIDTSGNVIATSIDNEAIDNSAEYDIFYFTSNVNAQVVQIGSNFAPAIGTLIYAFNVYAKQNDSVGDSTTWGRLYLVVSLARFNGDPGISANQTTNATTSYDWMAVTGGDENMPSTDMCSSKSSPYAYYVLCPCNSDELDNVNSLIIVGGADGGVEVAVGGTEQVPVLYFMTNGNVAQPTYSKLTFTSKAPATATVSTAGVVTGVAVGTTTITVSATKADGTELQASCPVTVE